MSTIPHNEAALADAWSEFSKSLSDEAAKFFATSEETDDFYDRAGGRRETPVDPARLEQVIDEDQVLEAAFSKDADESVEPESELLRDSLWRASTTPHEIREARVAFLMRYLDQLPEDQRMLLIRRTGEMATFGEMGRQDARHRSTERERFVTAVRALTRLIALEDAEFAAKDAAARTGPGRPRRDYAAEQVAAERVYRAAGLTMPGKRQ
jgi:hypothetical protein